jgi:hypothetical protein
MRAWFTARCSLLTRALPPPKVACELLQESSTFVPGEDAKDLLSAVTASTRVLLTSMSALAVLVAKLLTHPPTPRTRSRAQRDAQEAAGQRCVCKLSAQSLSALTACATGECNVSSAPVDIRALAADVVRTAGVGLALQSGTTIMLDDAAALPPSIQARASHLPPAAGLRC